VGRRGRRGRRRRLENDTPPFFFCSFERKGFSRARDAGYTRAQNGVERRTQRQAREIETARRGPTEDRRLSHAVDQRDRFAARRRRAIA